MTAKDAVVNSFVTGQNPVRAKIVKTPEAYRWSSLGYHVQTGNKDDFLSTDFGLYGQENMSDKEKLSRYRAFVYGIGTQQKKGKQVIDIKEAKKVEDKNFALSNTVPVHSNSPDILKVRLGKMNNF